VRILRSWQSGGSCSPCGSARSASNAPARLPPRADVEGTRGALRGPHYLDFDRETKMSEAAAAEIQGHGAIVDQTEPSLTPSNTAKLGMGIFLAGDAMTFGAGIAAYGALRYQNVNWPEPADWLGISLTAVMTFILICSSVTMVEALSGINHGNVRKM